MSSLRGAAATLLIAAGCTALSVCAGAVAWSAWMGYADRAALARTFSARAVAEARAQDRDGSDELRAPAISSPAPDAAPDRAPLPEAAAPDVDEWSSGRVARWHASRAEAAGERIALLEIPSVALSVVVLDGTSEWALTRGVGRIAGTARADRPGNLGIAGHRDGYFRALRHLEPGARIRLRTAARDRDYTVEWIRVVRPEDRWVLEPTDGDALTLVTCHPFWFVGPAPERYVVRARAVPTPP
jgi:sortase A